MGMKEEFIEYLISKNLKNASIIRYSDQAPKFILRLTGIDLFSINSIGKIAMLKEELEKKEEYVTVNSLGNRMYSVAINNYGRFLKYLDIKDDVSRYNIKFAEQVKYSQMDERNKRLKKLEKAAKTPEVLLLTTKVFKRSPDVVAEVLYRANGKCEECGKEAPFNRSSDGTPYLEVHHKIMLKDGGDDTLNNTQALCPNCHRRKHFG